MTFYKKSPKKIIRDFFVILLFILCIFAPEFRFIPHFYTWVLSFLGFIALTEKKFVKSIDFFDKSNTFYWIYLFLAIPFLIIPAIIHNTNDFSYLQIVFGIILCSLRSVLLLFICYRINSNKIIDEYIKYFILSCNIYVLFTLLFMIFPSFKTFWLNKIIKDTLVSNYIYYKFRYSLNGFAGFSAASILSFCCILCGYVIAADKKNNFWHVLQFMISVIGCFFYGRVAIVGIMLGIIIIILGKKEFSKKIEIITKLGLFFCILLIILNYFASSNASIFYWRKWAFAIITQLFGNHEITDYSYTHMINDMYFLPNFYTFLGGDGFYTDPYTGKYYMHTDVGYMRIILYTGFMGMIFMFGILFYILTNSYKKNKNGLVRKLIICIMILWFILEAKGESYQRMLLLFYPFFLCMKNFNNSNINTISNK